MTGSSTTPLALLAWLVLRANDVYVADYRFGYCAALDSRLQDKYVNCGSAGPSGRADWPPAELMEGYR